MNPRIERTVLFFLPILVGSALIPLIPFFSNGQVETDAFRVSPRNADPAYGSIQLSKDQIYRNETLEYNVTVAAFGWLLEDLIWEVDIQNATGNLSLQGFATKFTNPQLNNSWFVDPALVSAGSYQVVLWIKNGSDTTLITKDFEVLNNLPVIHSISAGKYSSNRGETFNVTVNATDVEIADLAPNSGGDSNIYVHVYYRDTNGVEYTVNAQNIGNGNYSARIEDIGLTDPTGVYTFWAGVQDYRSSMEPAQEITSDNLFVTIRNNNPTIVLSSNLIINDLNPIDNDVSVRMGNTINVTITASDAEGTIRFILINLLSVETGRWVNYTMNYQNQPHTLIINSEDLAVGSWYVFITVIDADGGRVDPPEHPTIEILAEPWTIAAPIVFFIIGLLVGMAIGSPLLAWRARQKAARKAAETPTKAEETLAVVDKSRKASPPPEEKEEGEEEETPAAEEPESESKTQMKRKIRRRIN